VVDDGLDQRAEVIVPMQVDRLVRSDADARWLRLAGSPLPVAVGHRASHHGHPLEWLGVLRDPEGRRMSRRDAPMPAKTRKLRCAVYTRKSTDEGLEKEFNSLDAQRAACEAFIVSQRSEGWVLVHDRYDDGGVSGGTLERAALRRLLAETT
jgi:hypothetical protein